MTDVTIQSPAAGVVGVQSLPAASVELTQQQPDAVEIISSAGGVTAIPEPASVVTVEQPAQSAVDVLTPGPQGPPGPPGADGYIPPKSPSFTYLSGVVTRIDYSDGSIKEFTYSSGYLSRIDHIKGAITTRKDFSYSGGVLISVTETELMS